MIITFLSLSAKVSLLSFLFSFKLQTSSSTSTFSSTALASPASTIESLTREFEHSLDRLPASSKQDKQQHHEAKSSSLRSGHSLDIKEATRGQFVVKPQDTDNAKAVSGVHQEGEEVVTTPANQKVGSSSRSSTNRSVGHYSLGPHRLVPLKLSINLYLQLLIERKCCFMRFLCFF